MTYEYECIECGNHFDIEQDINHQFIPNCIICGSLNTKKVWKVAGIDFKGPGFYKNDYKEK